MKILITNFRLAERTASEIYVRDIARALHGNGNEVTVFVSQKGKLAQDLEAAEIPVITHPSEMKGRPDIIHGQYNLETIAALLSFPDRPALYMSHGTRQWREHPPIHPRIVRYLALSSNVGEWLHADLGIKKDAFDYVPNYVDVTEFETIRRLPEEPAKALFYDRSTTAGSHLDLIRQACQRAGIELDFIGELIGKRPTRPEVLLPEYDLVFASGRSAIEALVSGCGVITVTGGKCGRLVTTNNFDAQRCANFSVTDARGDTIEDVDRLVREIEDWDWRSLAPVTRRLRDELNAETARDTLMRIYSGVIQTNKEHRNNARSEFPALTDWLIHLADQHHLVDSGFLAIQHRVSDLKTTSDETTHRKEELEILLEQEKAKVRAARRHLKDGNVMHQRLWKKIEDDWREIEKSSAPQLRETQARSAHGNPASSSGAAPRGGLPGQSPVPLREPRSGVELPR